MMIRSIASFFRFFFLCLATIVANFIVVACGTGIYTTPGPNLTLTSPLNGSILQTLTPQFTGTCDVNYLIQVTYGSNVIGPNFITCQDGSFTFNPFFLAIDGLPSLTLSQIDRYGVTTTVEANYIFNRLPFNVAGGFNETVYTLYPYSDGGVFVGGSFESYQNTAMSGLIKLTGSGQVDPLFPTNLVQVAGGSGAVYTINLIPQTLNLIIGGNFTSYQGQTSSNIASVSTTGALNQGFNPGTGFDNTVYAIIPVNDGTSDFYVAGAFHNYQGSSAGGIIRLTDSGQKSSIFSTSLGSGFNGPVYAITQTTDGSGDIFVGGNFTQYNSTSTPYLARLTSSGALNSNFTYAAGNLSGPVLSLATANDSSHDIFVGGTFSTIGTTTVNNIVRLTDTTGSLSSVENFGSGFNGSVYSLTVDGSGNLYATGSFSYYQGTVAAPGYIRILPTGAQDSTFVLLNNASPLATVYTSGLLTSGNPIFGGSFQSFGGNGVNNLMSTSTLGAFISTFNAGSGFNGTITAVSPVVGTSTAPLTGDIYVAGNFSLYNGTSKNSITRLQMNGATNTAFNSGSGFNVPPSSIIPVLDGTGDILVAGSFTTYQGQSVANLVRLTNIGDINSIFNTSGSVFNGNINVLLNANDGTTDFFVGGNFTSYGGTSSGGVIRLSSTGGIKNSFAVGSGFPSGSTISALALDGSHNLYVGGTFTSYQGSSLSGPNIVRLTPLGTLDSTFATGSGTNGAVLTLFETIDGSGDILVGGNFTTYQSQSYPSIVRLRNTGAINTNFVVGSGCNGAVHAISQATDGSNQVWVGGSFTTYQGFTALGLALLTPQGAYQSTFPSQALIGGGANVFLPSPDGSNTLYVGGSFNSTFQTTTNTLSRVSVEGTLN